MSNKDGRVKEDGYIYMVLEYGEIDLAHMLSQKWKELDSSSSTIDENWLRFYWQVSNLFFCCLLEQVPYNLFVSSCLSQTNPNFFYAASLTQLLIEFTIFCLVFFPCYFLSPNTLSKVFYVLFFIFPSISKYGCIGWWLQLVSRKSCLGSVLSKMAPCLPDIKTDLAFKVLLIIFLSKLLFLLRNAKNNATFVDTKPYEQMFQLDLVNIDYAHAVWN